MPGVQMRPDWLEQVYALTDTLFAEVLGPDISLDARDYCPVFGGNNSTATEASILADDGHADPGALRDSIEYHLDGHDLIVRASGGDRDYAAYVELGHHVVAWGYDMGYEKEAQPYLRPALYQRRTP